MICLSSDLKEIEGKETDLFDPVMNFSSGKGRERHFDDRLLPERKNLNTV
jgi:hypothetical protein